MSDNPFATEAAWEVSTDTILTEGDHATEVYEADMGRSSGGYPQIELRTGNADGAIRDWLVITAASYGKVVQLIKAVGIEPPKDDEVEIVEGPDGEVTVPTEAYLQKMVGKRVGTIVRPEPDLKNPGRTRDRVRGYVPVSRVQESDVTPGSPPPVDAQQELGGMDSKPQNAIDDDIPF